MARWPGRDPAHSRIAASCTLKKAVGRTIEWVMPLLATRSDSNLSLAFWNSSRGFCTQMADSSTKCLAPWACPTIIAFLVAR